MNFFTRKFSQSRSLLLCTIVILASTLLSACSWFSEETTTVSESSTELASLSTQESTPVLVQTSQTSRPSSSVTSRVSSVTVSSTSSSSTTSERTTSAELATVSETTTTQTEGDVLSTTLTETSTTGTTTTSSSTSPEQTTTTSGSTTSTTSASTHTSSTTPAPTTVPTTTTVAPTTTTTAPPPTTTTTTAPTPTPIPAVEFTIYVEQKLLDNPDLLNNEIARNTVVAYNGVFRSRSLVAFEEGMTPLSLLELVARQENIPITVEQQFLGAYVSSINLLAEHMAGGISGWTYEVNGIQPVDGASAYELQAGDVVEWIYIVG